MERNENIEISRILDIVRSKKLVIAFILMIFILVGYVYSYHYVVPQYKATSTLLLIPNSSKSEGTVIMNSDLTVNADLTVNSGLIETYRSIGENSKVIKQVINNLGLDMTEEELLKEMKITVMKDTYVIRVAVTNTDPQTAMNIAKEFDKVFLREIGEIYHLDNVGIVDEAQLPEEPCNINHLKDMVLFLGIGIGVAFVSIVIFYLFDNTIKKEEEIEKYIHLKSLGGIPINQDKNQEIVSREKAKSYVTECINTIRTNILYMNSAKNAKTILITSCTPREGKSWVSANIATAFAETDKKVLLIDSDMRKGRAHKIFKVMNNEGLSNYLYAMTGDNKKDLKLAKDYIQETKIPNLHILTNGAIPPNPSELIESGKMKDLLTLLKKVYDIIIVDAPPCKLVTDSIILSTIVDSTILVANSEKTKMKDFNEVKQSIQMVDGEIIGAILNKKKISGKTYSTSYYYGHDHSEELEVEKEKEMISVEQLIKKAIKNWKEDEIEVPEEIEEVVTEQKEEVRKGNIDYKKIKRLMETEINELIDNMKETNYMQSLLEKAEEEKLTKQDIKGIIKQEMIKVDYAEQIQNMKEIIKKNNEDFLDILQKEKENEQAKQQLLNQKIEEIQEETKKVLQEEIAKRDYTEQILKMHKMLEDLKTSHLELVNQVKLKEEEKEAKIEELPKETKKSKNIIDFKTLKIQKNKKIIYSIKEDIAYEDLEQTAACVITLKGNDEEACEKII